MSFRAVQLILPVLLLVAFSTRAEEPLPPLKVKSDREKVQFLFNLNQEIPTLFRDAIRYSYDLFDLPETQSQVLEVLSHDPTYQKLQKARPDRVEIRIVPKVAAPVSNAKVDEGGLARAKELLRSAVKTEVQSGESLADRIAKLAQKQKSLNTNGLLNGLIKTLPKEQQAEVYRQSMEQKIETLKKGLPEELVSKGFVTKNFGIEAKSFTREQGIALLENSIRVEQHLKRSTLIQLLFQDQAGHLAGDQKNLLSLIDHLTAQRLTEFSQPKSVAESARRFVGAQSSKLEKAAEAQIAQAAGTLLESVKVKTGLPVTVPGKRQARSLVLKEMSPHTSTYRSCIGGDCATDFSAYYTYSPEEKVFFIQDAAGDHKGYVAGTVVRSGQADDLYIHTIAGAKVTTEDVKTIFQALYQERAKLGVRKIRIPDDTMIGQLINSDAIKKGFASLSMGVLDHPTETMQYKDASIRKLIKPFTSTMTYDDPESNRQGYAIQLLEPGESTVKTTTIVRSAAAVKNAVIDRQAALEVVFGLIGRAARVDAKRFAVASGISYEKVEDLETSFRNRGGLKMEDYRNSLRAELTALGIDAEKFMKQNPALLMPGSLMTPEWMSVVQDPEAGIRRLIDSGDFATLGGINDGAQTPNFSAVVMRQLAERPASQPIRNFIRGLVQRNDTYVNAILSQHFFSEPGSIAYSDLIQFMCENGDQRTLTFLAANVFSKPHTAQMHDALKILIERANTRTRTEIVEHVFTQPHTATAQDLLRLIVETSENVVQSALATHVMWRPHLVGTLDLVRIMIPKMDKDAIVGIPRALTSKPFTPATGVLIRELLDRNDPLINRAFAVGLGMGNQSEGYESLVRELIEKGSSETAPEILASDFFSKPLPSHFRNELKRLIETGNHSTLQRLAEEVFSKSHTADREDLLKLLIEKGDSRIRSTIASHVFSQPHTGSMKGALRLLIEKGDPATLDQLVLNVFKHSRAGTVDGMKESLQLLVEKAGDSTLSKFRHSVLSHPAPEYVELAKAIKIKDYTQRQAYLASLRAASVAEKPAVTPACILDEIRMLTGGL